MSRIRTINVFLFVSEPNGNNNTGKEILSKSTYFNKQLKVRLSDKINIQHTNITIKKTLFNMWGPLSDFKMDNQDNKDPK